MALKHLLANRRKQGHFPEQSAFLAISCRSRIINMERGPCGVFTMALRTPFLVALFSSLILLSCKAPEDPNPKASPAPITIEPVGDLSLSPDAASIGIGQTLQFAASGGTAPYLFTVTHGSITPEGAYKAPLTPATVTVTVQDSAGLTATATVQVSVGAPRVPNDPRFSEMNGLHQLSDADIDAPEAWAIQTDCSGVLVGVLDSGVDYNHPDLAANIHQNASEIANNGIDDDGNGYVDDRRGWNFASNNSSPMDDNLHGTHVAGTIGAVGNNGIGVTGICWKASLVPLKFLDQNGSGFMSDAIEGIYYAADLGVKIINASFGGGPYTQTFKDALDDIAASGVLFVAAAGNETNDNDAAPSYPANYNSINVISVAATNSFDELAAYSNYGATSVHIAAPGTDILSTFPTVVTAEMAAIGKTSAYEKISGTSMATPHISGLAALLWSLEPSLTVSEVRSRILNRADVLTSLNSKVVGSRRLNSRNVLYSP